uniref:CRAL-TRIO domain-containing protein n=1 Tax=Physcomitrium patens TaxID=3218 RepID=A0A7I4ESF5_PHYPA
MDTDDATLLRFLRARSMCVPKACKMFAEHQKWRREYFPQGHAQEDEIKDELTAGKFFMQGHDRKGRPIALLLGAKHVSSKKTIERQKQALSYLMDKLICSMPPGEEKFIVISDLKDLKLKNLDFRGFISAFNFMQAYYPERLGKVYALHIPQLFWAFWKLVHPFLDDVTKAKISFVEDDKIEETLLKDISLEEIPTLYGGSKELVPLELAQPPGWPQFKPVT